MSNEEFYDAQIAPELLRLRDMCHARGMAFLASVEFDSQNSGIGRTEFCPVDAQGKLSAAQRTVHWAARCRGNIDRLIMAFLKHGEKHGHGSVYLKMLGCKNVVDTGNCAIALTVVSPNAN